MDLLPQELIGDILQRLPAREIAVCRTVSKDLRAVIDGRGLLVVHLVPRGLRGVFINFTGQDEPYFFSRRERAVPRVDGELNFLPEVELVREALHHSNGLLLVQDRGTLFVCNPATRRWAQLPSRSSKGFGDTEHLVFDPTVSLHYEVISFAEAPRKPKIPIQPDIERPSWCKTSFPEYTDEEIENLPYALRAKYDHEAQIKGSVEWPPSSHMAQVFSSRTGQWEERAFVREDDVTVTLMDVWSDPWGPEMSYKATRCNAVYWQGAFYIHCRGGFVMRLSLLEQKYKVIKTPRLDNVFTRPKLDVDKFLSKEGPFFRNKEYCLREFQKEQKYLDSVKPSMHFGKSEHGIYYTVLLWYQLRIWVLHEASECHPTPEWELKHKVDIGPSFRQHYTREERKEIMESWSLDCGKEGSANQIDCGWDSDDDSVINVEGDDGSSNGGVYCCNMSRHMDLLGYHPSKEIVFLGNRFDGFSYYLDSSKLQFLGNFYPEGCVHSLVASTHESFIYTPCMYDLLPNQKKNTTHDGDIEEEVDTDEDNDLEQEEPEEEVDIEDDEDLDEAEDEDLISKARKWREYTKTGLRASFMNSPACRRRAVQLIRADDLVVAGLTFFNAVHPTCTNGKVEIGCWLAQSMLSPALVGV